MTLELQALTIDCVIGERPEERTRTQRLRLDVALTVDETVCATDELADTVDYAALAERLRAALVAARCRMIERAARVALDICRDEPRARAARVRVTKFGAIPHLEAAAVVLEATFR